MRVRQELAAVEGDEAEQIENGTMPSFTEEDNANLSLFLPNPEQSDKVYGRSFPRTEFSLEPEENLLSTAFERGKRTSEDREESPVDAPLKEVFYEPIEEEEEKKVEVEERTRMTRSPRKRVATEKAQAAIASPRRKKAKPTNHTEEDSGSELSDLTDDEEEEEDEEEEGEEGEGTAGEDADSNLEEGTVASQIDEEEEEEEPEPTGRKRKAAGTFILFRKLSNSADIVGVIASRKPPPSKRRNARSASVATSDSRTAAERRKDQSTPSTRGRGRGAGGSGKKPVGRPPKVSRFVSLRVLVFADAGLERI